MKTLLGHVRPKTEHFEEFFLPDFSDMHDESFNQFFLLLDKTKSPGSPLCFITSNNAGIEKVKDEFRSEVIRRVRALITKGEELYDAFLSDPRLFSNKLGYTSTRNEQDFNSAEVMSLILDDPTLLKVKGEARPVNKQGRLVCMVSAIQNFVTRLALHNAMQEEQDSNDPHMATRLDIITPSSTDALHQAFADEVSKIGRGLSSSDVQGYEYSNTINTHYLPLLKWSYAMNLTDIHFRPIQGSSAKHLYLLIGLYYASCFRTMETEDGSLFVGPYGNVTSGGLTTFTDNSLKRNVLSNEVSFRLFNTPVEFTFSAGDDNLDSNPRADDIYKKLGFVITDFVEQKEVFTFCSTILQKGSSYQEGLPKFVANLLFTGKDFDIEAAFLPTYVHHPDFERFSSMLHANWRRPPVRT